MSQDHDPVTITPWCAPVPGLGTTGDVLAGGAPAAAALAGGVAGEAAAAARRVLMVEDNVVNQLVLRQMLEKLGYGADLAGNGVEALAALARHAYELVLMDVQMPEMDGLEATRRIRLDLPPQQQPWIIAVTAGALKGDREKCLIAGMDDYLTKPVRLAELHAALERFHEPGAGAAAAPAVERAVLPPDGKIDRRLVEGEVAAGLEELEQTFGAAFAQQVVEAFLGNAAAHLEALRRAVAEPNAAALRRTAHSLKGSCAIVGLRTLLALCDQLRTADQAAPPPRPADVLTRLEQAFAHARPLFAAYLARPG